MKVAILGFDVEGRASYEYYRSLGHDLTIHDQNAEREVPTGASTVLGGSYLDNLDSYDMLIRTPGLHPQKILDKNPDVANKIWSGTNEFFRVSPTRNIIGVTGTKGKGTTSTLIARILEAAGKRVHLGGNIGTPALQLLPDIQPDDWVVLELSNFQLIDCQNSPHIAVCLMVVPEHLDFHSDVDEYFTSKSQIFQHQTSNDIAVYNAENTVSIDLVSKSPAGNQIPYFVSESGEALNKDGAYADLQSIYFGTTEIMPISEVQIPGRHNLQNICAAIAATWQVVDGDVAVVRRAISSFAGLEHRNEVVLRVDHLTFINDTYSTGPHATIASIRAIKGPKILLLGGYDRNLPLDDLCDEIKKDDIRHIVVIGHAADRISRALDAHGITNYSVNRSSDIDDFVRDMVDHAKGGDTILFSPGFASFGIFKNFTERGVAYKKAVIKLYGNV